MQAGNLAAAVVSGFAMLLLIAALARPGRKPAVLAPAAFYVLVAIGICETISTEPAVQGLGAAGFAAASAVLALTVVRAGEGPPVFRWDEFETAFRRYAEAVGDDTASRPPRER